ncbi:hypothetical protein CALVIDRAFT_539536 [Calocera viscosa TUFC12733]|uniref:Uncharacterized protein n=1 Tax=Calocera viscosa (strain TUFC12733) TaxID=1330018 RepID=A0A167JTC1_CALVF|nr:hypothetical protein CALVIDRAFT_539536 [Calocera viscosa TUFC12733]
MAPSWSTVTLGVLVPGDPPVQLQYLDSHPTPPSVPYTTLIAVHGTGFNSRTFPSLPRPFRLT